ncbi:MAG: hypothetical protein NTV68_13165 [Methanomicrobiales archaeon]|nr:hypothetical protein [Methanomicrobiales archaeon]
MEPPKSVYRTDNGIIVIELVLRNVMQLFNSLDPSPFHEKELDPDAEEYIFNAVVDQPKKIPVKMAIYLPENSITDTTRESIILGIHNHFIYRSSVSDRELRRLFERGRFVLVIAMGILFMTLLARQFLSTFEQDLLVRMAGEGLLILGWVTLWEPAYIFIYGWWPIVQKRRIYDKITTMEIEVLPVPATMTTTNATPGDHAAAHGNT